MKIKIGEFVFDYGQSVMKVDRPKEWLEFVPKLSAAALHVNGESLLPIATLREGKVWIVYVWNYSKKAFQSRSLLIGYQVYHTELLAVDFTEISCGTAIGSETTVGTNVKTIETKGKEDGV